MKFSVHNLGCRVNLAELEKITDDLVRSGYTLTAKDETAELAIINTCTVTEQADKKSWRMIRRLAEDSALEFLFITGCYSELAKDLRAKLSEYAIKTVIVSQRDKHEMVLIVDRTVGAAYGYTYDEHQAAYRDKFEAFKQSRGYVGSLLSSQERFYGHKRALLKVQDGCNVFCSYCRIPYARGAPHSRAFDDILQQITALAKQGVAEVTLTGINLTAYYDKEAGVRFSKLLEAVCEKAKMLGSLKIRLSSLEPHGLDDHFFDLLKHSALTPHLHLPVQASHERILHAMKRPYTLREYKEIIDRIYALDPYFAISTDIITGYPGESEEEFVMGQDFIRSCEFLRLHVFPFSYRPLSTWDSPEKQEELCRLAIPEIEKKRRAHVLRVLSAELEQKKLGFYKSREQRFVCERELSADEALRTATNNENDAKLSLTAFMATHGYQLKDIRIFSGTSEYYLKGQLIASIEFLNKHYGVKTSPLGQALTVCVAQESPLLFIPAKVDRA